MEVNKLAIIGIFLALTQNVFADSEPWRAMGTFSIGPAWSKVGETQTIYLQPALPETFTANSSTQAFADGEIFLGFQHALERSFQAQVGLAFAATSAIPLSGDIWQDADPNFNNLFYSYKINHTHIAVKGKLLKEIYPLIQPYLSGSLGVAFNRAYSFSSTSRIFEVVPEPPFSSKTTTAFTYTLGIGIQRAINDHWALGVGYEFVDWGKVSLGVAPGQISNDSLSLNHVYTNGLQFSLSYVA